MKKIRPEVWNKLREIIFLLNEMNPQELAMVKVELLKQFKMRGVK